MAYPPQPPSSQLTNGSKIPSLPVRQPQPVRQSPVERPAGSPAVRPSPTAVRPPAPAVRPPAVRPSPTAVRQVTPPGPPTSHTQQTMGRTGRPLAPYPAIRPKTGRVILISPSRLGCVKHLIDVSLSVAIWLLCVVVNSRSTF